MRFGVLFILMTIAGFAYLRYVPLATRQRYEASPWTIEITLAALSYHGIWFVALVQWMFAPSDPIPSILSVIGAVLFCLGQGLVIWSMAVNPWFTKDVRWDQGQEFVTDGPYRWLGGHPSYSGMALTGWGIVWLTGQSLAVIPQIIYNSILLRRLFIEHRFLSHLKKPE